MTRTRGALTIRKAAALALSGLVLAGCASSDTGGEGGAGSPSPSDASSPSPSPSPSPTGFPEAADGKDVDACYDAACEILLTKPVDIPIDPKLNVLQTLFVTEVDDEAITVQAIFLSGTVSFSELGPGGANTFENTRKGAKISIEAIAISDEGGILAISVED